MSDDARTAKAKATQDYDGNPPRCVTCVYFRREPHTMYVERTIKTRKGKTKTVTVRAKKHPLSNPLVDRCSFGNFLVKPSAVCDEWRNRDGEHVKSEDAALATFAEGD